MTYQQLENLPQDVKDNLPKHGQQLFMAAYNAVSDNGMNEENATKVAWDSVKNSYKQDKDGNWVSIENSQADRGNIIGTDKDTSDSDWQSREQRRNNARRLSLPKTMSSRYQATTRIAYYSLSNK